MKSTEEDIFKGFQMLDISIDLCPMSKDLYRKPH